MDRIPKRSPLNKKLLVNNPLLHSFLKIVNFLLPSQKNLPNIPKDPKRILLSNLAHFGDLVISTTVLPIIKKKYPNCEIGFLAATAPGRAVLTNHPLISKIHFFDHWYLNRFQCKAALQHRKTLRQARQEVEDMKYEIAIDLYPYFPNAIPFFAQTNIPIRIGYTSGGFSNSLTHPVDWTFHDRYVGFAHHRLLNELGIDTAKESPLPSYNFKRKSGDYIVIHMGSSSSLKEWDKQYWIELIHRFEKDGIPVYLTGRGAREKALCADVSSSTKAVNLCDHLDWMGFVFILQEARLVVTVDTAAVHVSAASATPVIVLYAGINSPYMWVPPSPVCRAIMHQVPCAPCFNKRGCATMDCIKKIEVDQVYRIALNLIGSPHLSKVNTL